MTKVSWFVRQFRFYFLLMPVVPAFDWRFLGPRDDSQWGLFLNRHFLFIHPAAEGAVTPVSSESSRYSRKGDGNG